MKLANAVSKIAELPLFLEQHGIAPEEVISVQYNKNAVDNLNVLVQLHFKESIEKFGKCNTGNFTGFDGVVWTQYRLDKEGISFVCCERESEAIA